MASDIVLNELKSYGKALRHEDRKIYEEILKLPMKHFGSVGYAGSLHVWAFLLLSIILEQEKKIRELADLLRCSDEMECQEEVVCSDEVIES